MRDCEHAVGVRDCDGIPLAFDELLERCLGNAAFAERILSSFERRFEPELAQIELAWSEGNGPRVASQAHQLKGSAANASLPAVEGICGQIESLARSNDLAEIPACLERLREAWRRFREFRAELAPGRL